MVELEGPRFCRHFSPEEQALVRRQAVPRAFQAGEVIFNEGDSGDGLYIVHSGLIRITATSTPDRQPRRRGSGLGSFRPGSAAGGCFGAGRRGDQGEFFVEGVEHGAAGEPVGPLMSSGHWSAGE